MNIISLIDWFKIGNGASSAITSIDKFYKQEGISHYFTCDYSDSELPQNAFLWSEEKILNLLQNKDVVIFHYYHSGGVKGKGIFYKLTNLLKKENLSIPIITTVLQRPSYPYTILTPYIILNSSHIVFIDKTSYNDPLYKFIPKEHKSMFYCTFPESPERIKMLDSLAKERNCKDKFVSFIYGRGSTIGKCPNDTIDVFKKINVPSKKFIICGVDDESWIAKKALKESNITTYPNMKYENWEKMCSTFDVFLYYLPKDTYSSLDGNLGLAMRLGIPPIVFGPSAPKERIIHGVNGFIANTKEEIIYYAQLLFQDDNLRKNIGKNARDTTYSMLHNRDSIEGYLNLYKTVTRKSKTYNINIPFAFSTLCTLKKYMFLIQIECNRIQRALIMLINNPARFIKKFN